MYARGGGPAKPEEAGYDARPTEAGEREASVFFDGRPMCVTGFGALEDMVVVEEEAAGDAGTDADREESQAGDAGIHAVDALEYERVGFKEEVCIDLAPGLSSCMEHQRTENRINKSEIETGETDNGFGEKHF